MRGFTFAKFRETTKDAPSVAIQVAMPKLPAPPYPSVDEKPPKKQKALPTMAFEVGIGREYNFVTTGIIAKVRVEKIWQEPDNNTYVIVSQVMSGGRHTHAMHISEFRQRVIAGGIEKIKIEGSIAVAQRQYDEGCDKIEDETVEQIRAVTDAARARKDDLEETTIKGVFAGII